MSKLSINWTPNNTNNLKVIVCLKQFVVVHDCYYKGTKVVKRQGSYRSFKDA